MNGYDLDCAKKRLGITDDTQDTEVQAALDAALDLVENYLDRKLERAESTETFYCHSGQTISLKRYPLVRIIDSSASYKNVDMDTGLIYFGCGVGGCNAGHAGQPGVTVHYEGGYAKLPPALLMALCHVFDQVMASMQGGASVAAGAISRITIPDVGSITYASGSASGSGASNPLSVAAYILDGYRRQSA